MSKVLILKGHFIYTKTGQNYTIHENSYLVSVDGRVEGIYPVLPEQFKICPIKDHGNKLIIPGFVDLHLHAAQYLQCGMGMTKKLLDWLEDYTFDLEKKFQDKEFAKKAYTLFADKLVGAGTLRACIFASSSTSGTEQLFEVLKKKGIGAYVGKVNMDRNAPDFILETTKDSLSGTQYLIEKYKKEKLVKPIITPRFAPTSTDSLLKGLGGLAIKYDLPVQSHLCENPDEIKWVKDLFPGAANYCDVYFQNDLFGQTKTVMAHAIHMTQEEKELVKKMNVTMVHCPDSNLNVRSGIMPVRNYLDEGLSIGLGSDIAGGHKIGLNEAMVRAIQLSKLLNLENQDFKPLSSSEAFYMGTKGGGNFFGKTGSFEKNYLFDALVIQDDPIIAQQYSIKDRLEKFIYTGDDRNICERYVEGKKI